jgi:pimeloyl-ACP methyl ester carboxylesterase
MPEVSVNGANLFYSERGRGLPVVLVHGFPLDSRMWDEQLAALSERFRVIAPDLRGFGRSRSEQPFTIESLADDLHQLLAHIDALPCVLGGLSMGGYVAFAFVTKYIEDLKGLILLDTKAEADTSEAKQNRLKMIESVRACGSPAVADAMMCKLVAPETQLGRPEVLWKLRDIMESCPPLTIEHAQLAMCDRRDYGDELASIALPTLVVVGQADIITPPTVAQGMARQMPHAQVAIIPNAGHVCPMEEPGLVNVAMGSFLASLR